MVGWLQSQAAIHVDRPTRSLGVSGYCTQTDHWATSLTYASDILPLKLFVNWIFWTYDSVTGPHLAMLRRYCPPLSDIRSHTNGQCQWKCTERKANARHLHAEVTYCALLRIFISPYKCYVIILPSFQIGLPSRVNALWLHVTVIHSQLGQIRATADKTPHTIEWNTIS